MSSCFASDLTNVYEENENLNQDDLILSSYTNLEVSDVNVISHDENNNININNELNVFSENQNQSPLIDSNNVNLNEEISEKSSESNSNKTDTVIESDNLTKYYKNDTQFSIIITDNQGNPLKNVTISFIINGNVYNRSTNEFGVAQMNINLDPGNYLITTLFNGNENYAAFNVTNSIKVLSTIYGDNIVKYFKNGTQYYATILDGQGNPLANAEVTMNINGVYYTRTTDGNGTLLLSINLNPGEYILTVIHPDTGLMYSNDVVVLTTIFADDLVKYFKNGSHYYVTVLDGNGNPLANTEVRMNINGVFYTRTTDENGTAKLSINLNPDEYILTVIHPDTELMQSNKVLVMPMATIIESEDLMILYSLDKIYSVIYKDIHGNPIADLPVYFNFNNGGKVFLLTDANGVASFKFDGPIGDYIIEYGFEGSNGYIASFGNSAIKIVNTTNYLQGSDLEFTYGDNSSFKVKLTDLEGNPLANQTITFVINNKNYNRTTDENGIASISIGLYPNSYEIGYFYSSVGESDYNYGYNTVTVKKQMLDLVGKDIVILPNEDAYYEVILSQNGNPVVDKNIIFNVNGKQYIRTTDASGKASLKLNLVVGNYEITYTMDDDVVLATNLGKSNVLVNGTILTGYPDIMRPGDSFNVLLTDAYGNPIANENIKFTVNGAEYTKATNDQGIASIAINLGKGEYLVIYSLVSSKYAENSGQATILVTGSVSLQSVIAASITVRDYIVNNKQLPTSINVEGTEYSSAEFLSMLLMATLNIHFNINEPITPLGVEGPSNLLEASNLGNLYKEEYLAVATNILAIMEAYGRAPDLAESTLGNIEFESLVYSYARIVAFYGQNNAMPSYVSLKSLSTTLPQSHLNDKNTFSPEELQKYLVATTRCQVDDPRIQALSQQLTEGLTDDLAKANAIFEFCRYKIGYSFYYNSKYGAVGTLDAGSANCVDGSHLFIALCRAADLPARYVHGSCNFQYGGWIGHVWAQVLIGDTWVVADTSSERNSLGNVVSWSDYTLTGKYPSISF